MTLILKMIYKYYHDLMEHYTDPRTKDCFLAQSPLIPIVIVTLYFQFVQKWGPSLMKNRPAFNLNKVLVVYNVLQIVLSTRLFYLGCKHAYVFGPYRYICEPVDYSEEPLAVLAANEVHNYYLLKVLDLLDTIFFVLRKKQKQATFLHIYHHIGMVLAVWVGVRFIPGGHVLFIGLVNTFVHMVMYSYYLRAIFDDSSKIWWKKYITLLQIFQFGIITIQWLLMILGPSCGFPKGLALIFLPQNTFMTAMFLDFYYKAYIKK
ncbi:elongation of very long chain fatty acids protein 7-like [Episyrphus balteatus]|uniref:elongation of very long chain fatty acids protein 7-like n=1 Tax=Episyrphus balteatus TaxID=286459 RepID=UPI00248639DA|nr:elongation of very long chain fatty acids protein 7-like [Episyrphus balteatus]